MTTSSARDDPHAGQPVLTAGTPLAEARAAVVMLHGRGATAEDILALAADLAHPHCAYLAPQAAGNAWYPNSFMAPLPDNEPWLTSALACVTRTLARVEQAGIALERMLLLGFSQGACLATEYVARHARRYGGLVAWSGGVIGPDGTPRENAGTLASTPVFLGCSDRDPYIPQSRVDLTAEVLRRLGADVTERIYPHMAHTVNTDELAFVRAMVGALLADV